jgi:hypothetical protein
MAEVFRVAVTARASVAFVVVLLLEEFEEW